MNDDSDVLKELWMIKDELSSRFSTFQEYWDDLMKYQATHYPQLPNHGDLFCREPSADYTATSVDA